MSRQLPPFCYANGLRAGSKRRVVDSSLFTSKSEHWFTPSVVLDAVIDFFGPQGIDLDPCAEIGGHIETLSICDSCQKVGEDRYRCGGCWERLCETCFDAGHQAHDLVEPNVPAQHHLNFDANGLASRWHGNVFVNPPYGRSIGTWVEKSVSEVSRVDQILLLTPARTDTRWFGILRDYSRVFIRGRLRFFNRMGVSPAPAPFPSMITYLGDERSHFTSHFAHLGDVFTLAESEGS